MLLSGPWHTSMSECSTCAWLWRGLFGRACIPVVIWTSCSFVWLSFCCWVVLPHQLSHLLALVVVRGFQHSASLRAICKEARGSSQTGMKQGLMATCIADGTLITCLGGCMPIGVSGKVAPLSLLRPLFYAVTRAQCSNPLIRYAACASIGFILHEPMISSACSAFACLTASMIKRKMFLVHTS